ncbi:MAG: CHAT domain-containing protein [Saprospiraceae bacterium]|nr:CHAT domain-containing protein [Saprospiraceae bacterium]
MKEALDLLETLVPAHLQGDVVQNKSQLADLERQKRLGLLSFDEEKRQRAIITNAALELYKSVHSTGQDALTVTRVTNEITSSTAVKSKILFITANPSDQSRLQTDREHRLLKAELERGRARDNFVFLPPQFATTITELLRAVNDKPNIIHFSGHGATNGIAITTENNETQMMPVAALQRMFRSLKDLTKIVVLNACYTAEQAKIISEFGMYVVGNNLPITDPAAISFSEGFYNGLGEGKSFEEAYNDAMIVVLTKNPDAAHIIEAWKDGNKLDI